MREIFPFLNIRLFQNTIFDYILCVSIFLLGLIIIKIFRKIILMRIKSWSEKTNTTLDNFFITTIETIVMPFSNFGFFYLGTRILNMSVSVQKAIQVSWVIIFSIFMILLLSRTIDYIIKNYRQNDKKITIPRGVVTLLKGLLWIFGIIFLLDNLGFKVSTVLAGLGIGGVAVAMASQTILKDLFNYFVILLDRPFEIGDFIVFDEHMGAVEYIGIKSTRIRSSGGEELIVSNSELADSKLRNFKRMKKRVVLFTFGVSCETSSGHLEAIPGIIGKIINSNDNTEFVRAHFKSYGDFSFDFEVNYKITTTDYKTYLDINQSINIAIKKEFDKEGIEMPYPTQVVMLKKPHPPAPSPT